MPTAPLLEFTDDNFTAEVLEAPLLTLAEFGSTWNAPSRSLTPTLQKLADNHAGKLKVGRLNVDANQTTPQTYGIRSIPTCLVFKGGKVVEQLVGALPYSRYEAAVMKHF